MNISIQELADKVKFVKGTLHIANGDTLAAFVKISGEIKKIIGDSGQVTVWIADTLAIIDNIEVSVVNLGVETADVVIRLSHYNPAYADNMQVCAMV